MILPGLESTKKNVQQGKWDLADEDNGRSLPDLCRIGSETVGSEMVSEQTKVVEERLPKGQRLERKAKIGNARGQMLERRDWVAVRAYARGWKMLLPSSDRTDQVLKQMLERIGYSNGYSNGS